MKNRKMKVGAVEQSSTRGWGWRGGGGTGSGVRQILLIWKQITTIISNGPLFIKFPVLYNSLLKMKEKRNLNGTQTLVYTSP